MNLDVASIGANQFAETFWLLAALDLQDLSSIRRQQFLGGSTPEIQRGVGFFSYSIVDFSTYLWRVC